MASLISNVRRSHEGVVGQIGQANVVIQYAVSPTLRATQTAAIIRALEPTMMMPIRKPTLSMRKVQAKLATDRDEDVLGMISKLDHGRNFGLGEEHGLTGDAHMTAQTLTVGCITIDWSK